MFYQVRSYDEVTKLHMTYSVYEDVKLAESFKSYLEECNTRLTVWIEKVTVYFRKQ